jgi:hypothetical protein
MLQCWGKNAVKGYTCASTKSYIGKKQSFLGFRYGPATLYKKPVLGPLSQMNRPHPRKDMPAGKKRKKLLKTW